MLHLSDLHLLPRQRAKAAWVKSLGSLDADLVINTGDNIAGPHSVPALLDSFELLLDLPGVFVFGSNDYFAPKLKNPLRYLTKDHAKAVGSTPRLPTGGARARLHVGGLGRPDQPSRHPRGARSAPRLRRVSTTRTSATTASTSCAAPRHRTPT